MILAAMYLVKLRKLRQNRSLVPQSAIRDAKWLGEALTIAFYAAAGFVPSIVGSDPTNSAECVVYRKES